MVDDETLSLVVKLRSEDGTKMNGREGVMSLPLWQASHPVLGNLSGDPKIFDWKKLDDQEHILGEAPTCIRMTFF